MSTLASPLPVEANGRARLLVSAGIEDRLEALRRFHLGKRLTELGIFICLWPLGAAITLTGYWFLSGLVQGAVVAGGILVSAVALNAFVLLLHEGMHHTLFARPALNRWVSVVLGVPLLISFTAYQVLHLRHHHYLGDPRDPDDYHNYSTSRGRVWLMHLGRLSLGAFLYLIAIPLLAWRHGGADDRRRMVQEYTVLALIAVPVGLFVPGTILLLGWFLPAILVGYMTNIRGFTQHGITDASDPFLASRTMKPHPLIAWCLLNENYHLEHHLFPEVPSYHLRHLHELLWPRLPRAVVGRSYLAFLACFLRATVYLDETPIGVISPAEEASAP